MHARSDDPQELSGRVDFDWQALVWRQDADEMHLSGPHQRRVSVGIQICGVPDVSVPARVLVDRVPDGARVVDAVREEDFSVPVEQHGIRPAPPEAMRPLSGLGVDGPAMLGTISSMRPSGQSHRLVDREVADLATRDADILDDRGVRRIARRDAVRIALNVGHHQAAEAGVLGEVNHFSAFL